jgi:hypothetical protein
MGWASIRMNLRRKKPHDSLYMLLDTMCNAFGGIILLAVLVVLLTSKEKSLSATSSDSRELLQRRVALAQTNLQQSLQLAASLGAKAGDDRWKRQVTLLSTRKQLQETLQQTRDAVARSGKEVESAGAADPSERLKLLNAELSAAQRSKLEFQNGLAAAEENNTRLKQRLAGMERQVAAKLNDLQRPLRLPKEHETAKRVVYIIARYGRVYPCRNADLSRNETDIKWTTKLDGQTAEPIRGRGLDPVANARGLETYFSDQSKETVYLAFCVFQDSFPAFIRARQLAVASGVAYGWEPFLEADGPVVFSENGHTPKAQ